jgi:hypothetical protein
MLADVVVDTNVFVHAENPGNAEYEASREFINLMLGATTLLCLDAGFDVDESRNASRIAGEYIAHLPPGALAHVLIQQCAANGRISILDPRVSPSINQTIERLVDDPSDWKFVRVAHKSQERVLVTHDDDHLWPVVDELAAEVSVELADAYGCCELVV